MNTKPTMKRQLLNILFTMSFYSLNIFINIFVTPILIDNLGIVINGKIALMNEVFSYFQLFSLIVGSMANKFISDEFNKGNFTKASKYFSTFFFLNLLLSIFMLFLGLIFPFYDIIIHA